VNNLDARLELRSAAGILLVSPDADNSFGATISMTVSAGTYYLVVASHGGYGDVGQYTLSGTIAAAEVVPAPTGLTATVAAGPVYLSWQDNAGNETGYRVERSTDGLNWTFVTDLPANSTDFADGNASPGATYLYRVGALKDPIGPSYSSVTTAVLAPAVPDGLAATSASSAQINLTWNDVTGETGYRIERSSDGTTWVQAGVVGTNVTSYADVGLAANTTYLYRVSAVNAGGVSALSIVAVATTAEAPPVPAAPSNLVAFAINGRRVELSWQDNAANETGFIVQRSSNFGRGWATVAWLDPDTTGLTDGTVNRRRTYWYRVSSYNEAGSSAFSNVAQVTTPSFAKSKKKRPHGPKAADLPVTVDAARQPTSAIDQFFIRWSNRRRS
jgi:hypothetical protein